MKGLWGMSNEILNCIQRPSTLVELKNFRQKSRNMASENDVLILSAFSAKIRSTFDLFFKYQGHKYGQIVLDVDHNRVSVHEILCFQVSFSALLLTAYFQLNEAGLKSAYMFQLAV